MMKRSLLQKIICRLAYRRVLDIIPDSAYLRLMFWARLGTRLDLSNVRSLNEKVQWLKLYDRNEQYKTIVDKYAVRQYIAEKIGESYLVPLVGGPWNTFDEIDFNKLPKQFVLKTTHDSGGVVVCKDSNELDRDSAKRKLNASLKRNYFYSGREWPYKDIPHRIIAEKYMEDSGCDELKDYKILCFNGKPENVMVCTGRASGNVRYYFFDFDWNLLRYNYGDEKLPEDFSMPKPVHLNEMYLLAEKLSEGYRLVRVDLYEANNQVYFGELTLYPDSGFDDDITVETDMYFGSKLII